jgi:hypothetical protein
MENTETLSLEIQKGHMFVQVGGDKLLLDTGGPMSFCTSESILLAGQQFSVESSYMGLTPDALSQFIDVPTAGLLGSDILNAFDIIIDALKGKILATKDELHFDGNPIPLDEFMGIPILSTRINDTEFRMFFDTGAQISYLQDEMLSSFPNADEMTDFYPGIGQFKTNTHNIDSIVGESAFTIRCGRLPDLLGMALMMAETQGILGNQILFDLRVGYFPRRKELVL